MSVAMMALMISFLISCTECVIVESCNCEIGWLLIQLQQSLNLNLCLLFLMDMTGACISSMCDILGSGCVTAVHSKEQLRVYKQQQASQQTCKPSDAESASMCG